MSDDTDGTDWPDDWTEQPPPEDHAARDAAIRKHEEQQQPAVAWPIGAVVEEPIWGPGVPLPAPQFLLSVDAGERAAGVLELGTAGFLLGAGGVGKGWVALDLALSVAASEGTGHDSVWWMGDGPGPQRGRNEKGAGFPVQSPGHVLFLTAEDREHHIHRRLDSLSKARGLTGDQVDRARLRLHIVCTQDDDGLRGIRLQDNQDEGGAMSAGAVALVEQLRAAAEQRSNMAGEPVPWRLIVVDTLSRTAGDKTEVEQDMAARFTGILECLTDCNPEGEDKAAVIALHHTSKGSTQKSGAHASRGCSALTDNARWVALLTQHGKPDDNGTNKDAEWRDLGIVKVNHGRPVKPRTLRQDPETGVINVRTHPGHDDDDDDAKGKGSKASRKPGQGL